LDTPGRSPPPQAERVRRARPMTRDGPRRGM
jgi:hypothetical protein